MITSYTSSGGVLDAIRDDMVQRWDGLLALPSGSDAAIEGLASFLYDFGKLYWHKHGDGEIAMGLMAGYLDAKGFDVPDLVAGTDLSALSFQMDREAYTDAFFDGTIFETPLTGRATEDPD